MRRSAIAPSVPQVTDPVYPVYAEAKNFVEKVKARFVDQPSAFQEFVGIVRRYREESSPPLETCIKLAKLFRSHLDLYADFKLFLPQGFKPPELPEEKNPPPQFGDAMKFVENVKAKFGANSEATGNFLITLKRFREGKVHPVDVCSEMTDLFRNHQDLYEDFKIFLPPRFKVPALPEEEKEKEGAAPNPNADRAD